MGWARIIGAIGILLAVAGAPARAQDDATERELERYRQMLSEKTHEPQRQTIVRLLADEENRDDPLSKLDS